MEPASVVFGVLSLTTAALDSLNGLREFSDSSRDDDLFTEIEIHTSILEEMAEIALQGTSRVPKSALVCLKLCNKHLSSLGELRHDRWVQRIMKPKLALKPRQWKRRELEIVAQDFGRSVKLLRDLLMDEVTQTMIQQQKRTASLRKANDIHLTFVIDTSQDANAMKEQMDHQIQQIREIFQDVDSSKNITVQTFFRDPETNSTRDRDDLTMLTRAVEDMSKNMSLNHNADPFSFIAKILLPGESNKTALVCAKLDTGSSSNWISEEVIQRFVLQSHVQPCENPHQIYLGFGGESFVAAARIELTWTLNSTKSWTTEFLVSLKAPFDMIVGGAFIMKEGNRVLGEPVLFNSTTRLSARSKEDYQAMEDNIRRRGAENEELSLTREARDAADRARRRAEKAQARASLTTSPSALTPATAQRLSPSMLSSATSRVYTPAERNPTESPKETTGPQPNPGLPRRKDDEAEDLPSGSADEHPVV